jgi:hypothetical protein
MSLDEALLVSPRQADGSLPKVNFLRLKQGSDLINKGVDLVSRIRCCTRFGRFRI